MKPILTLILLFNVALSSVAQTPVMTDMKASIAGKSEGAITRKELLNAKGLTADKAGYRITEFKMTVVNSNGPNEFTGANGKLTKAMRNAIQLASPHAKVYFEYIKCIDKKGNSHLASPISIELK